MTIFYDTEHKMAVSLPNTSKIDKLAQCLHLIIIYHLTPKEQKQVPEFIDSDMPDITRQL